MCAVHSKHDFLAADFYRSSLRVFSISESMEEVSPTKVEFQSWSQFTYTLDIFKLMVTTFMAIVEKSLISRWKQRSFLLKTKYSQSRKPHTSVHISQLFSMPSHNHRLFTLWTKISTPICNEYQTQSAA